MDEPDAVETIARMVIADLLSATDVPQHWHVVGQDKSRYMEPLEPNARVWTVSADPTRTGWNTDSGYPGYGLLKTQAEELASAANLVRVMRGVVK